MGTFVEPAFWATGYQRVQPRVGLALKTAPAVEPVNYDDAYQRLRLNTNNDTDVVTAMLSAARQKVETDTGRVLITQSWLLYLDRFPGDWIRVPIEPLLTVVSIKTTSSAGVQSTVAASNYQVDTVSSPPRIVLSDTGSWPSDLRMTQAIVIEITAGYGAAAVVPEPLKQAILQLVEMWYGARGSSQAMMLPPKWAGYNEMIRPYQRQELA